MTDAEIKNLFELRKHCYELEVRLQECLSTLEEQARDGHWSRGSGGVKYHNINLVIERTRHALAVAFDFRMKQSESFSKFGDGPIAEKMRELKK